MEITMKKFNTKVIEKELLEINAQYNIKPKAAIQILVNNLLIYNSLLDSLESKPSNIYILYQMSSTIFRQLKEYKILPSSLNEDVDVSEDDFKKMIGSIKKAGEPAKPVGFVQNNKKDIETRCGG